MRVLHKILLNLVIAVVFFVLFYVLHTSDNNFSANFENLSFTLTHRNDEHNSIQVSNKRQTTLGVSSFEKNNGTKVVYNIWCIFTKVTSHAPMKNKFRTFANSLLEHTSGQIALHIITDHSSRMIAEEVITAVKETTQKNSVVQFYDVDQLAEELQDIVSAMQPHFSSQPGTYYSDALFFLSLGLHRIAHGQQQAAMFDADTKLRAGIEELFEEFERFGEPMISGGFPGLNSGVILFRLDRMRNSSFYNKLLEAPSVTALANKYSFKGHLGDQDFYTLLAMDHPKLIHLLPCIWNRQLCTWWRDHGYRDVFGAFAHCSGTTKLYHGNCNTPIPND